MPVPRAAGRRHELPESVRAAAAADSWRHARVRRRRPLRFQGSLDRSDEERANPWLLLVREQRDDAIPVIADANSMTYVLHRASATIS